MQLAFVDRSGLMDEATREYAQRRFLFALSRFDSQIDTVVAVLSDTNGPRGGVDKQCRVTVQGRRIGDIVVTHRDEDLKACLARTASRVGRAVGRSIDRERTFHRRPASENSL